MRCRHDCAINGIISGFFGSGSDVLGCDWRRNFIKSGDGFLFFVAATRLCCKTMCTVTTKQHNCRHRATKAKFKTWQQALHFLQSKKLVVFLIEIQTHFSFLQVGQYTSPIVSRTLLSTHNSFFLYLVD